MDVLMAARLIRLSIGVSLIWAIFYLSIRGYLLDQLRQALFAIRDDLFDFATDGGIAFDHPAYRELRDDLNSIIRFAHKISVFRLLLAHYMKAPDGAARKQPDLADWLEQVNRLPPLARRKLIAVRVDSLREVTRYIVQRSLLMLSIYTILRLLALWIDAVSKFVKQFPKLAEALEAAAIDEDRFAA
jgi:hypothetical protein